jgi:membrane associated rhomboid family serine protease
MFPLRDTVRSRSFPVVNSLLLAANVLLFILVSSGGEARFDQLIRTYALIPAHLSVADPASWATLVTSMFMHGSWFHVLSNMWTLYIFGDNVEDRMGRVRFAAFYFACGLAAGIVHLFVHPASTVPTVGASGAIAGVLGAYLRWFPGARVLTVIPIVIYPLLIEVPALVFLGFWFLTQLLSGATSLGLPDMSGGVAWWAHVGGFVAGFALAGLFARRGPEQLPTAVLRHHVLPDTTARRARPPAWP